MCVCVCVQEKCLHFVFEMDVLCSFSVHIFVLCVNEGNWL